MLKKSADSVLTSLRGSTYRSVRLASSFAAALVGERRVSARRGERVNIDRLFEHPDVMLVLASYGRFQPYCSHQPIFPTAYDVG